MRRTRFDHASVAQWMMAHDGKAFPDNLSLGEQVFYYSVSQEAWQLATVKVVNANGSIDLDSKTGITDRTKLKPRDDPMLNALKFEGAAQDAAADGSIMLRADASSAAASEALAFLGVVGEKVAALWGIHGSPHVALLLAALGMDGADTTDFFELSDARQGRQTDSLLAHLWGCAGRSTQQVAKT